MHVSKFALHINSSLIPTIIYNKGLPFGADAGKSLSKNSFILKTPPSYGVAANCTTREAGEEKS